MIPPRGLEAIGSPPGGSSGEPRESATRPHASEIEAAGLAEGEFIFVPSRAALVALLRCHQDLWAALGKGPIILRGRGSK
ncbi:hypothetical protein Pla86_27410 [Planctomycetes bacterium Pla86]|uniref:Uncharacterized protein n=1 Tax=Engelhardtia mirabilis TaxID=2528011 RepID=A0A518BKZ9_9BACT|nr:hypothetical protein Pla133_27420 [Planctomycetes bacterium Pla133]QDV01980.1 hypothetical protein Pla86_27410 [Planctomycetes bacterium Pla86]